MENVVYFGYGANRSKEMMQAITGNEKLVAKGVAVLSGYKLCVQRIDQVPDTVLPNHSVKVSAQEILRGAGWGKDFVSYTIKEGSPEDRVVGTIFELTPRERALVRDWELVDGPKPSWYEEIETEVILSNGQKIAVVTEGLGKDQEIDMVVDGMNYETFLNKPVGKILEVAEESRRQFLERELQRAKLEGTVSATTTKEGQF